MNLFPKNMSTLRFVPLRLTFHDNFCFKKRFTKSQEGVLPNQITQFEVMLDILINSSPVEILTGG